MKTRCIGVYDKAGDAITAFVAVGSGKNQTKIGLVSTTDPEFAAVDDPVFTVLYGFSLNCPSWIRTTRGL